MQARNRGDTPNQGVHICRLHLSFGHQGGQAAAQLVDRALGCAFAHIKQLHRVARLRCHLRNACAHDASAYHQHFGLAQIGHGVFSQGAGRLSKKAAKPARASGVARTRLMVCAVSSRVASSIAPGVS